MKYIFKRLGIMLLTMLLVSFLAFSAFDLLSGDAVTAMLGTSSASPEAEQALREELGLNQPLLLRYQQWLFGVLSGDLGESYHYHQPVWELLAPKAVITLCLSTMSFLLILTAIPLGLYSGKKARGPISGIWVAVNQFCMAVPPFFTGILLSWLFGMVLHWFMPGAFPGFSSDPLASFWYLVFPAIAIAIPRIAMTARMLRSNVVSEMRKPYVQTAISRGNDRSGVLRRHVLRNVMASTVSFLAQTMAEILAAGIVVEQVFGLPGLGRMLLLSISNRDIPVVLAIVMMLSFWVVAAGTLADLINMRIDPRLRLGGAP